MVASSEMNFKTFFLTFILSQIIIASSLNYFGILLEKPILININQIFIIISILVIIGICIGRYVYNCVSKFSKALENHELFKIDEDENIEEVNKYDLNGDLKKDNEEEENNYSDEILNQNNEELNEYLSNEYNKAVNSLMDLIQSEISKKDD